MKTRAKFSYLKGQFINYLIGLYEYAMMEKICWGSLWPYCKQILRL